MIEKYLLKGIRLKWQAPSAHTLGSKDGSVIEDPVKSEAPMVYDGVDAALGLGLPHVSTLGLTMNMNIQHQWLTYSHGHTTKRALGAGDVLTGPMSGCLIAQWTEMGRWVGHVGTVEANPMLNQKVKQGMALTLPDQASGFYPDKSWDPTEIMPLLQSAQTVSKFARPTIFALITSTGQFYSVLMFHMGGNEWCVGGCKKANATSAMELKLRLAA